MMLARLISIGIVVVTAWMYLHDWQHTGGDE